LVSLKIPAKPSRLRARRGSKSSSIDRFLAPTTYGCKIAG